MRKKKTRKCKRLATQASDERDLLVKKIADKIEKARFVNTMRPNEEKVMQTESVKRIMTPEEAIEALKGDNRMV